MARRPPRVDLQRDQADGRYRWRFETAQGKPFSRREDCLAQAGRMMGFDPERIAWLPDTGTVRQGIYDYGQVTRANGDVIEVFVWKRWWRR